MPTKVWTSGEELKAADINQYLQVQSVMVFADAAARTAAIPSPTVGMTTYLVSTGALEIYTDKTSPASWRPPWNLPWGMVHQAVITDLALTSTAQVLVPTLPCNLPGRYYKVEAEININVGASAAQTCFLQVMNGGTQGTIGMFAQNAGWWFRAHIDEIVAGALTNNVHITARIDTSGGTNYGRVRVLDVGPV